METILKRIFSTEHYTSGVRKSQANLLYWLASLVLIAQLLIIFVVPGSDGLSLFQNALNNGFTVSSSVIIATLIAPIVTVVLLRIGNYNIAAWLLNSMLFAIVAAFIPEGIEAIGLAFGICFLIVFSTITLNRLGLLIIGGGIILFTTSLVIFRRDTTSTLLVELMPLIAFWGMNFAIVRLLESSQKEGSQVESIERFKLAEINTRITRQASERVSLDDTLENTLDFIIKSYPQFYHAQVFLIDKEGVQARLVASTGEAGQQLIEKGHSLAVGTLSVIGQTTFKGEPVIARSNDQESVHRQNLLLPQTRVEAAFPLRIGDTIIGALDLQSRQDLVLSDYDMLTYQSLANSLSLAIDSIQQYEAAQARVEENQRLTEQTRIALRDVERLNQRLIGRAWSEYLSGKGNLLGLDIDLETNEVEGDTQWTETLSNAAQSSAVVQDKNLIAVPLKVRGVTVGAMEFELDEGSEFTPAEMELVQEVSDRFGLAAENTRLVEESQRIAQRESLINEISTRLQSAINIEATLAEAARSLSDTLHANKVMIRLGKPTEEASANGHANGVRE